MTLGNATANAYKTNIEIKEKKLSDASVTAEQKKVIQQDLDKLKEKQKKNFEVLTRHYDEIIQKEDYSLKRLLDAEYYNKASYIKKSEERDSFAYENSNLRARKDDLASIVNKLLKAADVQTSVDDLVGSDSLQNTIAKQIKEKIDQARGHSEVLESYRIKTAELEQTLKALGELKKEVSGTEAEKEEARRKMQEQEEKLKKQEISLKVKESENEGYKNTAEEMVSMQLEIERLKKENEQLKGDRDDFKDVTLGIKQDTDELNVQNDLDAHEDL